MRPSYTEAMPLKLRRALVKLGKDISIARRKRHISVDLMCERALLSRQTYRRIEKGDPSVSLGAVGMVLHALGEVDRIGSLIDIASDDVGLMSDLEALPKRVRRAR